MKGLVWLALLVLVLGAALAAWTRLGVRDIESKHPPIGQFTGMPEALIHYLDRAAGPGQGAEVPLLFVHGASGNLKDQWLAYEETLSDGPRRIYVDRPGHGHSDRAGADDPAAQAARYVDLLDQLEIERAILVCHSLGCASAAAMAVEHGSRVAGLVFVSPATHPWPGGVTWYYEWADFPILGWLFTETLVLPVARFSFEDAIKSVFAPNPAPRDYGDRISAELVLRPAAFRANAHDVHRLKPFVETMSKRYGEITVPTEIITGDTDDIVAPGIHSVGLERDIKGARLTVLPGVGHKPDYVATDTVVEAIERVQAAAR